MTLKRINAGRGHRYTLDGRPVPGVTTLIKKGLPAPGLMYWSAKAVAEYVADADPGDLDALRRLGRTGMVAALKGVPWGQRDQAAVRGTEVHALAEQLVHGREVDVPDHLAAHVESCLKFLDQWRVAPVMTETVVGSRAHKYGGSLDLIADLPDGRRALFDYKTGASGIWPETALQLAAYRHADIYVGLDGREHWLEDIGVSASYAVHVRADGYDVIPVDTGEQVFAAFLDVARVARITDVMDGWIGEAEPWGAAA